MKRKFSKDGRVMTVTTAAQAVRLAFDGWRETTPAAVAEQPASAEPEENEKPTPPRKRTSSR